MNMVSCDAIRERSSLVVPEGTRKILLHSCCAPCSGGIMEELCATGVPFAVFYCNPNIDTREEYERRKEHNKRFAGKLGVPFVDADYDPENWQARVKGLENEPERGARCTQCFLLRLERAAFYAHENGFDVLATSLGLSRWKDLDQVNACGRAAAERYEDVRFSDCNWRKNGGTDRSSAVAKREGFYRQKYCGCIYSRAQMVARSSTSAPTTVP